MAIFPHENGASLNHDLTSCLTDIVTLLCEVTIGTKLCDNSLKTDKRYDSHPYIACSESM